MIVDAHVHLITGAMVHAARKRFARLKPGLMERVTHAGRPFLNTSFLRFLATTRIEDFARLWTTELDRNRIDHALFLPISGAALGELDEFVALDPKRFSAYVFVDDPTSKKAVKELERWVKTGRFRGIKLYPAIQRFSIADERAFPLYEAAGALGVPVLIHFGVTHAPVVDYRYTNPLDLQYPAKMFPETKFIIAHFGAGFFREALLLGYHVENIHLDTSGTNNWRLFLPEVMPLRQVFKRALEVYGPERILFGTDTALNGQDGYRSGVLREQKQALAGLKLPAVTRAAVMGGNAARLFGLQE